MIPDRHAALEDGVRREADEIGEQEQVGLVAGRDGAEPVEPVPLRRVEGGHHERILGRDARRDGVAHHPVDVAVVGDVLGVAVVGAERHPAGAELVHERQQRLQVARHRGLADQEPHAGAQPLAALVDGQCLVVRANARRGVRLQLLAEEPGRVAVDVGGALERELRELVGRAVDDAGEVHHLGEAEDAAAAHQRLQVAGASGRRGDSNGEAGTHEGAMKKTSSCKPDEASRSQWTPSTAEHVRDLVRVGDDRGRPEREDEARELVDEELHRLDVHVRVDEAGDDVAARCVDRLAALVRPEPGDHPVDDRDVAVEPLAREDREHAPAADDGVGGLVAAGDGEASGQVTHGARLTPGGGGRVGGTTGQGTRAPVRTLAIRSSAY